MEKNEILDLISNEIRNGFLVRKIGDIRYRYRVKCKNYNYDCFSVMEFLVLYKIEKLEKLGIITLEIANNLRELLALKLKYQDMLSDEIVKTVDQKEDEKLLGMLCNEITMIDYEFKKYHLLPLIEDIDFVIECIIKNENYDFEDDEKPKELIKK